MELDLVDYLFPLNEWENAWFVWRNDKYNSKDLFSCQSEFRYQEWVAFNHHREKAMWKFIKKDV